MDSITKVSWLFMLRPWAIITQVPSPCTNINISTPCSLCLIQLYSYRTNLAGMSSSCWLSWQPHCGFLSHAGHWTKLARCNCDQCAAISLPSHVCSVWSHLGSSAGFRWEHDLAPQAWLQEHASQKLWPALLRCSGGWTFVLDVGREIPILIRLQTPSNYDDQRAGDNQYHKISPQPFEEMLVATPKAWDWY